MAKEPLVSEPAGPMAVDDFALVEQVRAGDVAAFGRLVGKYQDRVLNTCWRITGHLDDAQDLTQDAFLQAMEKIGSFRQQASFYTWLFRIAVNLSVSHRRKSARWVRLSLHGHQGQWSEDCEPDGLLGRISSKSPDPPAQLSAGEIEQQVLDSLDSLDEEQRAVVVLRDIEGLDYRQMAEVLEISVGTVKSRLHRARMTLREQLKALVSRET